LDDVLLLLHKNSLIILLEALFARKCFRFEMSVHVYFVHMYEYIQAEIYSPSGFKSLRTLQASHPDP